jgi:large subunit ribosomal protein L11
VKKGKQPIGQIKLQVAAGKANPAPPIGPALGQRGLNIMEFCKQFNELSKEMESGVPVPVVISYYADKTFAIELKTSPTSFWVRKKAKLDKGSATPGRQEAGKLTYEDAMAIAQLKMKDMGLDNINSAVKSVMGTAMSMGIKVINLPKE